MICQAFFAIGAFLKILPHALDYLISNLKRRIESVHEGKKPFKCNICEANFSRKDGLKTHVMNIHEQKKPLKCSICEATFSEKIGLKTHILNIHKENKS